MRTNRHGMLSVRQSGEHHVNADLLDGYGRVVNSQSSRFDVR